MQRKTWEKKNVHFKRFDAENRVKIKFKNSRERERERGDKKI